MGGGAAAEEAESGEGLSGALAVVGEEGDDGDDDAFTVTESAAALIIRAMWSQRQPLKVLRSPPLQSTVNSCATCCRECTSPTVAPPSPSLRVHGFAVASDGDCGGDGSAAACGGNTPPAGPASTRWGWGFGETTRFVAAAVFGAAIAALWGRATRYRPLAPAC